MGFRLVGLPIKISDKDDIEQHNDRQPALSPRSLNFVLFKSAVAPGRQGNQVIFRSLKS